jgi:uncharacterized protein YjiS (DUF1127 family)
MFLAFVLTNLRQWRRSRTTARQLSALTGQELSDIGISRGNIPQASRQECKSLRGVQPQRGDAAMLYHWSECNRASLTIARVPCAAPSCVMARSTLPGLLALLAPLQPGLAQTVAPEAKAEPAQEWAETLAEDQP